MISLQHEIKRDRAARNALASRRIRVEVQEIVGQALLALSSCLRKQATQISVTDTQAGLVLSGFASATVEAGLQVLNPGEFL